MADRSLAPLKKKATLLRRELKQLEDSAGVGLVEKMQGEGERFSSKDKGLATKGIMKILNFLLEARENQTVSSPRYNQIKAQLLAKEYKKRGGGYR
jgi:glutathionyl-hydroquinone reductase